MDLFERVYKVARLTVGLVVVAGVCGTVVYGIDAWKNKSDNGIPHTASEVVEVITDVEDHDMEMVQEELPYSVYVDYEEVILGKASQECDLRVMTMAIQVSDEISKPGLFGWETIFGQSQGVVYHADVDYYVDLSELDADDYVKNDENHTITITVPYPTYEIHPDVDEYEFFSPSNGVLRFGEFQITPELQTEIESEAMDKLDEEVQDDEASWAIVENYARLSIENMFQSCIDAQTYENMAADANAQFVYYDIVVEFA